MGVIRLLDMTKTDDKKIWRELEEIYVSSFPECERKPLELIKEKLGTDAVDMLAFQQEEQVIGLAFTMEYKDLVLLDYFAMDVRQRGRGCGSEALRLLQERFSDKKFYLEIERLREYAANIEQRKKRKSFFLKNGMQETGMYALVSGTEYEILAYREPPSYEEYASVYDYVYGKDGCRKVTWQS